VLGGWSRCGDFAAGAAAALVFAAAAAVLTAGAHGQQSTGQPGWDSPAAEQFVRRAIARRALPLADTLLQQYTARADGTVQFLLESEAAGGAVPLRLDQVSVDLYWQAPGRTHQAIRALRKQDLLPIRQFQYYADRLTLVQEGFGDRISIGHEQDVRGVPHPLSPDGPLHYHYRLADTLTLHVPGLSAPIRVVQVEVQPRDASEPAFVGALFVEAEAGTLVRMRFTFTPASYVDPRTERIHVDVEHSLWEGRYWLPYRQELEVRRQAPEVDFGVATVIRAQLAVSDYDFESAVVMPPGRSRITFPIGAGDITRFEETLAQAAARHGLQVVSAQDVAAGFSAQQAALRMLRRQPDGLPRARLHVPSFSSLLRANRAEGTVVGGGVSIRPGAGTLVTVHAGFATGPEHANVRATLSRAVGDAAMLHVLARVNDMREIEPAPAGALFLNSVTTLLGGRDWLDPYYVTGVGVHMRRVSAQLWWSGGLELERHEAAHAAWTSSPWADRMLRPVLPVEPGTQVHAVGSAGWQSRDVAPRLSAHASTSVGVLEGDLFMTTLAHAALKAPTFAAPLSVLLTGRAGATVGAVAPQHLFLPAGTRTLPGVAPTTLAGSRFLAGGADAALPIGAVGGIPLTAHAAINGAAVDGRANVPESWDIQRAAVARASATFGISAFGGIVRIDWSHGLPGFGQWRVTASPRIAPLM
jgi:hypothetical protein